MNDREIAPFRRQDHGEVAYMVRALEDHQGKSRGKGGFSCRKSVFPVAGSDIKVSSWKMQDWDYKKPQLPTYARGLFTYKNSKGQHEIAVRGYDKFFNHGEVRKTEWRNVERNTRGPYELSVKENGCIIFMSGLEDGTLLVCSKHSTGDRTDVDVSHAAVGERWVEKHLASVGKTRQDLARKLREMNATAVAELCDDAFEEHVLAYTPETAGLYLHGINLNLPEFATYPAHLVDKFADEWGFKKTMHLIEDNIQRVKTFLDQTAETGRYAGRATEGFVIRCQARETENSPWQDWFFKYKFEEPYLMYRQWRECTKMLISGKEPRVKKHNKITWRYLEFAKRKLATNPELGKAYQQNHGIIKLRDEFLEETGLSGEDIISMEAKEATIPDNQTRGDIVLVPVATIGCGKTTVALALVKLFGWGHVQNDNIQGKGRPPRFAKMICDELKKAPVVIADRNNHMKSERKQLIEDVSRSDPLVKFVALHYKHKHGNDEEIRRRTRERVFNRGDNHQTIQAQSKGPDFIIEIMEGFMQRFQPVDSEQEPDDMFDEVIDLDATEESRENLETVVSVLTSRYPALFGDNLPSAGDLDDAIEWALKEYKTDIKHTINADYHQSKKENKRQQQQQRQQPSAAGVNGGEKKQKPSKVEYFGVSTPFSHILSALEVVFGKADAETAKFYRQLQQMRRVQKEFHVTLIHRAMSAQHAEYWAQLSDMQQKASIAKPGEQQELGKVKIWLERIMWDDRLMAIVVRLIPVDGGEVVFRSVNVVPHITVGTANDSIKPKESNDMLQRWNSGQSEGIRSIAVEPYTEVFGVVKAVNQRF